MAENGSYALWLMPAGAVYDLLARVILDLSRRHGSDAFEPHVTLLANISATEEVVASRCRRLAAAIEPYPVQLTTLDQLNEYYRCVFVRVRETTPVMDSNIKARKVFGRQEELPYMPHVSLLYGNFDEATRLRTIETLGDSLALEFTADRFYLIDARGGPKDWRKLEEFSFRIVG